MRRLPLFASMLAILVLFSLPAVAQEGPTPLADTTSYTTAGANAVGSNGVLYQTTSTFSYSIRSFFGGASTNSATSTLYSYDPEKQLEDKKLTFTGAATALAIGKDDRLFMIVGKNLYLIPTPFPASLSASLEQVSIDVTNAPTVPASIAASAILRINLAAAPISLGGSAYAIKVKAVGSKEYLYLDVFDFQWSPFKFSNKVLILDSADGKKLREIIVD